MHTDSTLAAQSDLVAVKHTQTTVTGADMTAARTSKHSAQQARNTSPFLAFKRQLAVTEEARFKSRLLNYSIKLDKSNIMKIIHR